MATILSKSPPPNNPNDVGGTVKNISNYLIYLHENLDYLIGQLKKADSETAAALEEMSGNLTQLSGTVSSLGNNLNALQQSYSLLERRVAALENAST